MEYNYIILIVLIAIICSIFFSWVYFLIYTIKFLTQVPKLQSFTTSKNIVFPKVSVILPARNEEKYIQKCLKTLIEQDYSNYEIVVINDSSSDRTGGLIEKSLVYPGLMFAIGYMVYANYHKVLEFLQQYLI